MAFVHLLVAKIADFLEASGYEQGCPIGAIAIEAPSASGLRQATSDAFGTWSDHIAAALVSYRIPQQVAKELAPSAASALQGAIIVSKADQSTVALRRTANLLAAALA